jgi:transcriptional regulator with XRE-family HTH domain
MTGLIRIPVGTALSAVINDMLELTGTRPAELARLTGFAEGQISKWRRGIVVPSAPVFLELLAALGYQLAIVPIDTREDA